MAYLRPPGISLTNLIEPCHRCGSPACTCSDYQPRPARPIDRAPLHRRSKHVGGWRPRKER